MALLTKRTMAESLLQVNTGGLPLEDNHILEPEYHQAIYVEACESVRKSPGAFQVGKAPGLTHGPVRGTLPDYADDEDDSTSLEFEGMVRNNGIALDSAGGQRNVCALKSACIRQGFIDFSLARSVTRTFYANKQKAQVKKGDVLINSTGDGTIGRVAVYNADFPAIADGHITILRLANLDDAWYLGAFLLSELGQLQMYRYINGSSGQVEIYPQDIARVWVKPAASTAKAKAVADGLRAAASLHSEFYKKLRAALSAI